MYLEIKISEVQNTLQEHRTSDVLYQGERLCVVLPTENSGSMWEQRITAYHVFFRSHTYGALTVPETLL